MSQAARARALCGEDLALPTDDLSKAQQVPTSSYAPGEGYEDTYSGMSLMGQADPYLEGQPTPPPSETLVEEPEAPGDDSYWQRWKDEALPVDEFSLSGMTDGEVKLQHALRAAADAGKELTLTGMSQFLPEVAASVVMSPIIGIPLVQGAKFTANYFANGGRVKPKDWDLVLRAGQEIANLSDNPELYETVTGNELLTEHELQLIASGYDDDEGIHVPPNPEAARRIRTQQQSFVSNVSEGLVNLGKATYALPALAAGGAKKFSETVGKERQIALDTQGFPEDLPPETLGSLGTPKGFGKAMREGPLNVGAHMTAALIMDSIRFIKEGPAFIQREPLIALTMGAMARGGLKGLAGGAAATKRALGEGATVGEALSHGRGMARQTEGYALAQTSPLSWAREGLGALALKMPGKWPEKLAQALVDDRIGIPDDVIQMFEDAKRLGFAERQIIVDGIGASLSTLPRRKRIAWEKAMTELEHSIPLRHNIQERVLALNRLKEKIKADEKLTPDEASAKAEELMRKEWPKIVDDMDALDSAQGLLLDFMYEGRSMRASDFWTSPLLSQPSAVKGLGGKVKEPPYLDPTKGHQPGLRTPDERRPVSADEVEGFDPDKITVRIKVDQKTDPVLYEQTKELADNALAMRKELARIGNEATSIQGGPKSIADGGASILSAQTLFRNMADYLPISRGRKFWLGKADEAEAARERFGIMGDLGEAIPTSFGKTKGDAKRAAAPHMKQAKAKYTQSIKQQIRQGALRGANIIKGTIQGMQSLSTTLERYRLFQAISEAGPHAFIPKGKKAFTATQQKAMRERGFMEVPTAKVKGLKGIYRFGALTGGWIRTSMWGKLKRIDEAQTGIARVISGLTSDWKKVAVVGNPGSHLNALFGHAYFQIAHGGSPTDMISAAKSLKRQDKYYISMRGGGGIRTGGRHLSEEGAGMASLGSSFRPKKGEVALDFADAIADTKDYAAGLGGAVRDVFDFTSGHWATESMPHLYKRVTGLLTGEGALARLYSGADTVSKLAIFKRVIDREAKTLHLLRGGKMSKKRALDEALSNDKVVRQAIQEAEDFVISYDNLPHAVGFVKNFGIAPFIAFPFRMLGQAIELQTKRPLTAYLGDKAWNHYWNEEMSENDKYIYSRQQPFELGMEFPIPEYITDAFGSDRKTISLRYMNPIGPSPFMEAAGLQPGALTMKEKMKSPIDRLPRLAPPGPIGGAISAAIGYDIGYGRELEGAERLSRSGYALMPSYMWRIFSQLPTVMKTGRTLRGQKLTEAEVYSRMFGVRIAAPDVQRYRKAFEIAVDKRRSQIKRIRDEKLEVVYANVVDTKSERRAQANEIWDEYEKAQREINETASALRGLARRHHRR